MRKLLVAFLGALTVLAVTASSALAIPEETLVLKVFDQHGNGTKLSASQAKAVMHGEEVGEEGWDTDALLDPETLEDVYAYPLYTQNSNLRFDIPEGESIAFSVAWPTDSEGYSTLILDNGGEGFAEGGTRIVLNFEAAKDAKRRLDEALEARPSYEGSEAFEGAYEEAESNLALAEEGETNSERGKYGQRALDALSVANDLMLSEYGPQYAHDNELEIWGGLTLDDPGAYSEWASLASEITEPAGWVRIVFDPSKDEGNPAYYEEAVEEADEAGLQIVGQPIDSYFANQYTRAEYLERFEAFVDAFPQVDAWEVGNEVNGCWVDSLTTAEGNCKNTLVPSNDRIKNKIADAASYVREKRPEAQTVLTLYWQLGSDYAKWATFNWPRAELSESVREDIDVVLLSQYVEDSPMGLAFDPVMEELHAEFPEQKIGLGELDYFSEDTSRVWWAFNRESTLAGRRQLASHYYAAAAGYPFSVLGGFWWYFAEEMPEDAELREAVSEVIATITAP